MSAENIQLQVPLNTVTKQMSQHKLTTAYTLVKDLKWLLLLLKLLGLLPIFKVAHTFKLVLPKRRSFSSLYTHCMRLFTLNLIILDVYLIYTPAADALIFVYGDMDNATIAVNILLAIATYAVILWQCVLRSHHFVEIINKILLVDQELQLHPRSTAALQNNCGFYKRYMYLLLLHTSLICFLKWLSVNMCIESASCVALYFIYLKQTLVIKGYIIFVAILLHLLATRFHYLNNFIQTYTTKDLTYENVSPLQERVEGDEPTECESKEFANEGTCQYFPSDALFFYRIHNELLEIYKMINNCVQFVLLVFSGYFFYTITLSVYQFYFAARLQADFQVKIILWCCISLCIFVPIAVLLMRCCDVATKEANETSIILARIYGRDNQQQSLIDKFLSKNIKQNVHFTACGFFTIDMSTFFKVCSAITTYLVILIQFRQLEDARAQNDMPKFINNQS